MGFAGSGTDWTVSAVGTVADVGVVAGRRLCRVVGSNLAPR